VEKADYLLHMLEGEAKKATAGYAATEQDYPLIVEILQKEFGTPTWWRNLSTTNSTIWCHLKTRRRLCAILRASWTEFAASLVNKGSMKMPPHF
jgi:hypothetical protein